MIRACCILTLLAAAALGGCAGEAHWVKPGADAATHGRDLANCRALAARRAAQMGATGLPPATSDPRFGAPTGPSQAEQRLLERQLEDGCMRQKGYALVPGPAAADK